MEYTASLRHHDVSCFIMHKLMLVFTYFKSWTATWSCRNTFNNLCFFSFWQMSI